MKSKIIALTVATLLFSLPAAADMQTAIQALGTVDVPSTASGGGTLALGAATVAERLLGGLS